MGYQGRHCCALAPGLDAGRAVMRGPIPSARRGHVAQHHEALLLHSSISCISKPTSLGDSARLPSRELTSIETAVGKATLHTSIALHHNRGLAQTRHNACHTPIALDALHLISQQESSGSSSSSTALHLQQKRT